MTEICRVLRGGSFYRNRGYARSAYRDGYDPLDRNVGYGFRVVVNRVEEKLRMLRGGSFYYDQRYVRSAYRDGDDPHDRSDDFGFRVVVK